MTVVGFVVAAGVGTLLRWEAGRRLPPPVGTLTANLVGSFGLGVLHGAGADTATVIGGTLRPDDDASEAKLVTPEEIPWKNLAFKSSHAAIGDWLRLKGIDPPKGRE